MDVGVLGAGRLGRGIVQVCSRAGHDVSLHASEANDVMDGIDAVERALGDAVEAGALTRQERVAAVDRIDGTTGLEAAVTDVDVVIETERQDPTLIQEVFATVEELVADDTLIATGTTAVRVTAAAAGLQHPERAVGLLLFDPPDGGLVEVAAAEQTSPATADRAVEFVENIGLHPVLVRDVPGVVASRLAVAQEVEAMRMVSDGVTSVTAVDEAMVEGYAHEMGPLERADRVGLDARLDVLETLVGTLGERFEPPAVLRDLVATGRTGAGSGEGFYEWENGEPVRSALPDPEIPLDIASHPDTGR